MTIYKFGATYGGTKNNFIVKLPKSEATPELDIDAVLCVMQNLLQRGQPSKPDSFLQSRLGTMSAQPVRLIDDVAVNWNNIKGDDATRMFYDEILPEYLGEYSFAKNLILPETDFADILLNNRNFDGQQTDFYFPQLKLAIEIDGASHDSPAQRLKDKQRDDALKAEGIATVRLKNADVENKSARLSDAMSQLKNKLAANETIKQYAVALSIKPDDPRVKYDAVMRMQLALLQAFKAGIIDLRQPQLHIDIINSDLIDAAALLSSAYEDLSQWLASIAQLAKLELSMPRLSVNTNDQSALTLDICMFKRYADGDEHWGDASIYVRTDYFDDKDYYRVATAPSIKYKISEEHNANDVKCLRFLLKNIFGHGDFRRGQLPIIRHVLGLNDTIGILPTGTGKSLCYQLAALLQPGVSMVVVPIFPLMRDQLKELNRNLIDRFACISNELVGAEKSSIVEKFKRGKYQFLFVSPECFRDQTFRDSLKEMETQLIVAHAVIDEVHCLSDWGHDFRVSYPCIIPSIRKYFPSASLLGLTATSSQAVLNDLKAAFDNDGDGVKAMSSTEREELIFKRIIVDSDNARNKLIPELCHRHDVFDTDSRGAMKKSVGLIFCQTVGGGEGKPSCNNIYNLLSNTPTMGRRRTLIFHGQLTDEAKQASQQTFMSDDFSGVMVCNPTFGMSIDKANVKYTIHASLPQSIEAFYQEAGRAGRDDDKSNPSYCYIIYLPEKTNATVAKRLFDPRCGSSERKRLSQQYWNCDLGTVMNFWNDGGQDVETECQRILAVNQKLSKGNSALAFVNSADANRPDGLSSQQSALYKLSLLGAVRDWTVKYFNPSKGELNVEYAGVDLEKVEQRLLEYIRKYDAEFSFNGFDYKTYYNARPKSLANYLKILLTWGNYNVLSNRLQALSNMMELCSVGADGKTFRVSDKEFRQRLNDYFKCTEQTSILDAIIQQPLEYSRWFEMLTSKGGNETFIDKEKAIGISASIARYLESYGNNTGLNYLSGVLRLLCRNYKNTEGERRLLSSLRNVSAKMNLSARNEIIDRTLAFGRTFELEEKNMLSEALLECFPTITKRVFEALGDQYSLSLIIDESAARLKRITEDKINGKFIL